jgi:hypothetical protein
MNKFFESLKNIYEVNKAALSAYSRGDPPAFPSYDESHPSAAQAQAPTGDPPENALAREALGPEYSAIRTERVPSSLDEAISTEGDAIDTRGDFISYHSHRY